MEKLSGLSIAQHYSRFGGQASHLEVELTSSGGSALPSLEVEAGGGALGGLEAAALLKQLTAFPQLQLLPDPQLERDAAKLQPSPLLQQSHSTLISLHLLFWPLSSSRF